MNTNYVLPITIVVAGALIAGAVFFVGTSSTPPTTPTDDSISIRPYDAAVDHILGNPSAPVKVIEYMDLECPHCTLFQVTMHQIMDYYGQDGKVAWVSRHFPLAQIHSKSPKEAEAAECAALIGGNEGYWKFVDTVFEVSPGNNGLDLAQLPQIAGQVGLDIQKFNTCLNSGTFTKKVTDSYQEAYAAGARGTPQIFITVHDEFVPGSNLSGAQSYSDMRALIDNVLSQLSAEPQPQAPTP